QHQDARTIRTDGDRAPVGEWPHLPGSGGDEELERLALADAVEEQPVTGPGIDDVASRTRRPADAPTVDPVADIDVADVRAVRLERGVDALDVGDRPVGPQGGRVGAALDWGVVSVRVASPEPRDRELVAVAD